MAKETIRTEEGASVIVAWPTDPTAERLIHLGFIDAHPAHFIRLTADQVQDLRATLQRAHRRVWPRNAPTEEAAAVRAGVDAGLSRDDALRIIGY